MHPAALICTSGTASTEYSSAVAEAKLSQVPLIVVTTDRPSELTNIGAPQAIDQHDLYGNNTKHFSELNLQDDAEQTAGYIRFETQRSVILAKQNQRGPVQFNLPLRKPLMPQLGTQQPVIEKIIVEKKSTTMPPDLAAELSGKKVLIIAGPEVTTYHQQLIEMAKKCHFPIVSDVLSNTRTDENLILNNFDLITKLADPKTIQEIKPDVIIRFGNTLVSAPISTWLAKMHSTTQIINVPTNDLADYTLSTTRYLQINELDIIDQLANSSISSDLGYTEYVTGINHQIEAYKRKLLAEDFSEMSVPEIMDDILPTGSNIFLSNSMPVRDFENFYRGLKVRNIYCNRGANGIDGVVSSALGTATASNNNYLVTGDLALFHDMNGLMMAKRYNIPIKLIVINNNGGGIFSFLPQAEAKDSFDLLFGTPQNLDFEKVASLYGFEYSQVSSAESFATSLRTENTQQLIEVTSNRNKNVELHQRLENALQARLNASE